MVLVGPPRQFFLTHLPKPIREGRFTLKIFLGIFEENAVLLQETIDFHSSSVIEQTADLRLGQFARAITLEGYGFQDSTRYVLVPGQVAGDILGQIDVYSHKLGETFQL